MTARFVPCASCWSSPIATNRGTITIPPPTPKSPARTPPTAPREDLKSFPEDVRLVMGYALYPAQVGSKHPDAKPLRGFGGVGVLEVVEDFDGDTYRAVFTVKLQGVVFALHAFQSKTRKKTPQQDLELVVLSQHVVH